MTWTWRKKLSPVRKNVMKSDTDMMQKTVSPVRKTVTKSDIDMMQKTVLPVRKKMWWKVTQTWCKRLFHLSTSYLQLLWQHIPCGWPERCARSPWASRSAVPRHHTSPHQGTSRLQPRNDKHNRHNSTTTPNTTIRTPQPHQAQPSELPKGSRRNL